MTMITALCAFLLLQIGATMGQLSEDFYQSSCPRAESIITSSIASQAQQDNVIAPSMLRLFAHDCFVEGCDASILIDSTSSNAAERDFSENRSFPPNPFTAIAKVKLAVEAACPGVVSCADILAIAARDAVVLLGGPTWAVPKGRRDGLISQASRVPGRLPGADFDASQLIANFASLDLSTKEMITLSGAHTVGFSHCDQFSRRIYNFSAESTSDPTMSAEFVTTLRKQCAPDDVSTVQAFDISTPFSFDNLYYAHLLRGEGLLASDDALVKDASTVGLVRQFSLDQNSFFDAFVAAMIKMSSIGVKTGSQGEIRRDCSRFNT